MDDSDTPGGEQSRPANRMWTPWRMAYVASGPREAGCVFCNRFRGADDRAALILHRGRHCFVIMNLFPYAIGHVMIVPNDHVPDPEQASLETLREMADLLPTCLRAARSALSCAGFNVGINVGAAAGAGVADHLHEHIVPRWPGDANFMPILASTMIMPELPPVTYAKLRAEFERPPEPSIALVILDRSARRVLLDNSSGTFRLPAAFLKENVPVWRSAVEAVAQRSVPSSIIDWAGAERVGTNAPGALLMQASADGEPKHGAWESIAALSSLDLTDVDATILGRLLDPALQRESV